MQGLQQQTTRQEQGIQSEDEQASNTMVTSTGSYREPIVINNMQFLSLKESCKGGSLMDILFSHSKMWGYADLSGYVFNKKESQEIYGLLTDYLACFAVASGTEGPSSVCRALPGQASDINKSGSPREICESRVDKYAGLKSQKPELCDKKDMQFCQALLTQKEKACDGLFQKLSGKYCSILSGLHAQYRRDNPGENNFPVRKEQKKQNSATE